MENLFKNIEKDFNEFINQTNEFIEKYKENKE